MFFDLKKYIVNKIKNFGVKKILFKSFDTYKNEKEFFSYRRSLKLSQNDYGRCISLISLK